MTAIVYVNALMIRGKGVVGEQKLTYYLLLNSNWPIM